MTRGSTTTKWLDGRSSHTILTKLVLCPGDSNKLPGNTSYDISSCYSFDVEEPYSRILTINSIPTYIPYTINNRIPNSPKVYKFNGSDVMSGYGDWWFYLLTTPYSFYNGESQNTINDAILSHNSNVVTVVYTSGNRPAGASSTTYVQQPLKIRSTQGETYVWLRINGTMTRQLYGSYDAKADMLAITPNQTQKYESLKATIKESNVNEVWLAVKKGYSENIEFVFDDVLVHSCTIIDKTQ